MQPDFKTYYKATVKLKNGTDIKTDIQSIGTEYRAQK